MNHIITTGCTPLICECSNNLSYYTKSVSENVLPYLLLTSANIIEGYLYKIKSLTLEEFFQPLN